MSFSEDNPRDDYRSPSTGQVTPPAWSNTFVRGLSDEQFQERKQSLDCTAIKVSIPAASTTTKKPGDPPHTVYIIHVTSGITQWNIKRRYSDFYYIHQLLKKYVIDESFPSLPPKRFFGSSTDSKFVEERRIQLEKYIKAVVMVPQSWTRIDIVQFLDNENNTLLFVWNFERMRKMQDVLSRMTMENKNQTERLTEELKVAKDEVSELKNRLSQMEMLFLQHATGVAATKLTPTALRSLSGGGNGSKVNIKELLQSRQDEFEENEASLLDSPPDLGSKSHDDSKVSESSNIIEYDPQIFVENQPEMIVTTGNEPHYNAQEVIEIMKMTKLNSSEGEKKPDSDQDLPFSPLSKRKSFVNSSSKTTTMTAKQVLEGVPPVHPRVVSMSKHIQDAVRLSNELLDDKLQLSSRGASRLPTSSSVLSSPPETNPQNLNENIISPTLPPLPPPADQLPPTLPIESDIDESILKDVLLFYPSESCNALNETNSKSETYLKSDNLELPESQAPSDSTGSISSLPPFSSPASNFSAQLPPPPEWLEKLYSRFTEIIVLLLPSQENVNERLIVLNYVRTVIHRSLGAHVYPFGSFSTRTFLPGGDIDISAFLTADQLESWFVRVNEAMCLSSVGNDSQATGYTLPDGTFKRVTIRNVSFINAWVKIVKGIVNNIEVDISANQIGALYAQALIDRIDEYIARSHLFKRSILLIKAWCKYESGRYNSFDGGVFGAREGRLSTWTIVIMIVWIFNKYGRQITHPFQALVGFLCYFSSFDWTKYALTIQGPVSAEDLRPLPLNTIHEFYLLPLCGGYIPKEIIELYRDRFITIRDTPVSRKREKTPRNVNSSQDADDTSVHSEASRQSDDEIVAGRSQASSEYGDDSRSQNSLISSSYYKRGLMNVMDPIQVKHNTTRAVDLNGYRAIVESIYNGKKAIIKLCSDMKKYVADPSKFSFPVSSPPTHASSGYYSTPSSPARPSSLLSSSLICDIPIIRSFLENTLQKINEHKQSNTIGSIREIEANGYPVLRSCSQQIELSLKHAELILGSVVTPEALAKLIVSIIENKGPLPVGEIGKILQEMTGNENLSNILRASYRGLKKVVEGFNEVFFVGGEHPFNPCVHLHENYIRIRNECWFDDSKLVHLFVFNPDLSWLNNPNATSPRPRGSFSANDRSGSDGNISTSNSNDSYEKSDHQFLPLSKARSFKDPSSSSGSYDRGDVKRSGSMSSVPVGIATGMLMNPNQPNLASSPSGNGRGNRKNKNNNGNNNANPPPRHSKQSSQANSSQQQQYLQQQQQYYQQQYQQQIQYQHYLHQQQLFFSQQQLQLQQSQSSAQSSATTSSGNPLTINTTQNDSNSDEGSNITTSTVLEETSSNLAHSTSPPPLPPSLPNSLPMTNAYQFPMIYHPLSLSMPFPPNNPSNNSANSPGGPSGRDPGSPTQSVLSTSPTTQNPFLHPVPIPMGYYPHMFNPTGASSQGSQSSSPASNPNINPQGSTSPLLNSSSPGSLQSLPSLPPPTVSSPHASSIPVMIPPMMKPPPPYTMYYGSPPGNGVFGQFGLSPQSVGAYMIPSSLPPHQSSLPQSIPPSNSSTNSDVGVTSPPPLPRGHTS